MNRARRRRRPRPPETTATNLPTPTVDFSPYHQQQQQEHGHHHQQQQQQRRPPNTNVLQYDRASTSPPPKDVPSFIDVSSSSADENHSGNSSASSSVGLADGTAFLRGDLNQDKETATMMDEDDQNKVIDELESELAAQTHEIQFLYRLVCIMAVFVSVVCEFFLSQLHHDRKRRGDRSQYMIWMMASGTVFSRRQDAIVVEAAAANMESLELFLTHMSYQRWIHIIAAAVLHKLASDLIVKPRRSKFSRYVYAPVFVLVSAMALCCMYWTTEAQHSLLNSPPTSSPPLPAATNKMLWSDTTLRKDVVHDSLLLHQGLFVANLLTAVGGFGLQWDRQSTDQAFCDVKASRYRYKTL